MVSPSQADPFASKCDLDRFFVGRHQEEATAHLSYALREGEGFTVITGAHGVGKTCTCRAFVAGLAPAQGAVAYLSGPIRTSGDLLLSIHRQFGLAARGESTVDLTNDLNTFLMQQRVAGRKVMVFIDDAQTLPVEVLEQVRLISNLETTRDKLIHIILVGEPGLVDLLDSRELRQMGQRVSVRYEIGALTEEETERYIHTRLGHPAEGVSPVFTREAIGVIYRHTHGNPRLINRASAAALGLAEPRQARTVDRELAEAAIGGFTPPPASRRRILLSAAAAGLLLALLIVSLFHFWNRRTAPQTAMPAPVVLPMPPLSEPPQPAPMPERSLEAPKMAQPNPPPPAAGQAPVRPAPPPSRMTHSVQVGAFLQAENARQFATRLTARGEHAYVLQVSDARGRAWQAVRVGDFPSRQAAQSYADEFTRRERINALVRPFGVF